MTKLVVIIMNFNWLDWPKKQAEFYTSCGHRVVIVDNGSTYPPLLEWYKECPYEVMSTKGHKLSCQNRFPWEMDLHNVLALDNYYAVTDADLDVSDVPKDFADILIADIERNPEIIKSGFSLAVDDLPDNTYANKYRDSETRNLYDFQLDEHGFRNMPVDTTFAIYSKERCNNLGKLWKLKEESMPESFLDDRYFYRSHRSPAPYIAKHMPWYLDINNLTNEQLYHIMHAEYGSLRDFKNLYTKELKAIYGK